MAVAFRVRLGSVEASSSFRAPGRILIMELVVRPMYRVGVALAFAVVGSNVEMVSYRCNDVVK